MNQKPVIHIDDLKKNYGEIEAVRGISFDVHEGEMFGLVGPDGAGKTTTIRILCGLSPESGGNCTLLGKSHHEDKKFIQNEIGYLSQKFSLYGDLTIDENIEFAAVIHNVIDYKNRREELLDFTRLKPFRDRLADKLSGGMRQKLALACSLIHKPKILFLDEPTTGVDPVSRRDFWKILSALLQEGLTILLTTPYLDEAERCNRVALMNKGEIISLDTPQNIKAQLDKDIMEVVCSPSRDAYKILSTMENYEVQMFGDRLNVVVSDFKNDSVSIEQKLIDNKINVTGIRQVSPSLENVFIHKIESSYS
jgi:ABC-2 type transport system ATP-binding protein